MAGKWCLTAERDPQIARSERSDAVIEDLTAKSVWLTAVYFFSSHPFISVQIKGYQWGIDSISFFFSLSP